MANQAAAAKRKLLEIYSFGPFPLSWGRRWGVPEPEPNRNRFERNRMDGAARLDKNKGPLSWGLAGFKLHECHARPDYWTRLS